MQKVVIDKPYRFFPPFWGTFWVHLFQGLLPGYLRRTDGVHRVMFLGLEHLRKSLDLGYSVVLTPNHARPADPAVMGMLSREMRQPFFYMASWHLFMQGVLQRFVLQGLGAFSVYREGADKTAVKVAVGILTEGKRPLVIFPEGRITRTNDRVQPFMEGIDLVVHLAAKERSRLSVSKPVMVHPVAIKYFLLTNPEDSLHEVLDQIERRFFWRLRPAPLSNRIVKVGQALLTLKELEYFNKPGEGLFADRLQTLIRGLLGPLEKKWLKGKQHENLFEGVNALRRAILHEILEEKPSKEELAACWEDLADIYLALQLSCYPPDYLGEQPSLERLTETVERFEEDTTDKTRIHGKWEAKVTVGEGLEISAAGKESTPLHMAFRERVQAMIDAMNRRG